MDDVRVSVVIPNYWDGELIHETLRSVQRGSEVVEVVVVDDHSPEPSTMDCLREYQKQGLITTLVQQPRNSGVGAALNRAVELATSRYVFVLGNDDLVRPMTLKRFADVLDQHPEFGFAVGGYQCFGARTTRFVPKNWDAWSLLYRNLWPGCFMVRRDVYTAVGGNDEELIFHDWDLFMRLAEHGYRGYVAPDIAYDYRVHSDGRLWASSRRNWADEYRRIQRRHPMLFSRANRKVLWRASISPYWYRLWLYATAKVLLHVPPRLAEWIFLVVQGFDKRRMAR